MHPAPFLWFKNMSLLTIKNLTYQVADKLLYQQANFSLHPGEHLGVTGNNGVGKSTLLKLLQAEYLPDQGDISWQPSVIVGYLDQHAQVDLTLSIHAYLASAFVTLFEAEKTLMALYADMATDASASLLNRAAQLQSLLEKEHFYSLDHRIEQVANGLGIDCFGLSTLMGNLSGGQRHKVMLAKLLLQQPDVLLLDEPTNYLDTDHVTWLGEFLSQYRGAFMVVSHDTAFLDKIANGICDIDFRQIRKYKGHYTKAMAQKAHELSNQAKQFDAQQREIQKLEQYIDKNGAGVNAKMANGRKKQLAKIERLDRPEHKLTPVLNFASAPLNAQQAIVARNLHIGYQHPLLPAINLHVQRGEKIAITGFNGLGKSTLLKTLIGEVTPLAGQVETAKGIQWGYFAQDLNWRYPDSTPLQVVRTACSALNDKTARQKLAQFGISGRKAQQALATLSGGEQTKVKLCCLAVTNTNVLILDEPTTHLDVDVKSALKEALIRYQGTVVIVSHESEFVSGWPDRVLDISRLGHKHQISEHQEATHG